MEEQESSSHAFFLNPDHTHFILVDDDNFHIKFLKFRVALEKRLQKPLLNRRSKKSLANLENSKNELTREESRTSHEGSSSSTSYDKIPIVSLLIGGGIGSISLVLTKIYQGIPILVFKGTGHAPDLISGTYEDFADRFLINNF